MTYLLWASIAGFLTVVVGPSLFARNSEINRIYRSGHYVLRGDTGIADADEQEAIWYNPAGLALGTGIYKKSVIASPQVELSSQAREVYNRVQVKKDDQTDVLLDQVGEPIHLGVSNLTALVLRRAAIAATVSNRVNVLVRKDPTAGALETVDADFVSNQALSFSLAEGFFNQHLLIGGSARYLKQTTGEISQNIIDAESLNDLDSDSLARIGTGYGLDLGLMLKSGKSARLTEHSFGLTISDVGETTLEPVGDSTAPEPIRQTINVGYTLSLGTKISRMKLLLDFHDLSGNNEPNALKRTHIGGEINVADFVGLCGGLNQGYSTAGLYVDIRLLRIDFGYYTEERGDRVGMYPDQRYVLRLQTAI